MVLLTKCGPKQFLLTKCGPYNVRGGEIDDMVRRFLNHNTILWGINGKEHYAKYPNIQTPEPEKKKTKNFVPNLLYKIGLCRHQLLNSTENSSQMTSTMLFEPWVFLPQLEGKYETKVLFKFENELFKFILYIFCYSPPPANLIPPS